MNRRMNRRLDLEKVYERQKRRKSERLNDTKTKTYMISQAMKVTEADAIENVGIEGSAQIASRLGIRIRAETTRHSPV